MKITIHQPNFMPWYPFFQKMQDADVFVILSHCQFEKNNFQNRFNIGEKWFTMSTFKGLIPINKKEYINAEKDWNKIKINLIKYKNVLDLFDECISNNLSDTNSKIIKKIATILEIKTLIVEDYNTNKIGTERLVDICIENNAETYISGTSGKKYLELEKFNEKNINVIFQETENMIKKPIIDILLNKI